MEPAAKMLLLMKKGGKNASGGGELARDRCFYVSCGVHQKLDSLVQAMDDPKP